MTRGVAAGGRAGVGRRLAMLSAGALLVAGALGGCRASEPEPTMATTVAAPTATTLPTTTDSTIAEPPIPDAMGRDDEVGALAAAEYFMALYEYVLQTGDDGTWALAAGDECGFCSGLSESVRKRYADGGRYERGSPARYSGFSVASRDESAGTFTVELAFATDGVRSLDSDGSVASTAGPEHGTLTLGLVSAARGWVLLGGSSDAGPAS